MAPLAYQRNPEVSLATAVLELFERPRRHSRRAGGQRESESVEYLKVQLVSDVPFADDKPECQGRRRRGNPRRSKAVDFRRLHAVPATVYGRLTDLVGDPGPPRKPYSG